MINNWLFVFGVFLFFVTCLIHILVVNKLFFNWSENDKFILYRGYIGSLGIVLIAIYFK
jgi:hypothetical protein